MPNDDTSNNSQQTSVANQPSDGFQGGQVRQRQSTTGRFRINPSQGEADDALAGVELETKRRDAPSRSNQSVRPPASGARQLDINRNDGPTRTQVQRPRSNGQSNHPPQLQQAQQQPSANQEVQTHERTPARTGNDDWQDFQHIQDSPPQAVDGKALQTPEQDERQQSNRPPARGDTHPELDSLKRNDQELSARLGSLQAGRDLKIEQQEQDGAGQYAAPPVPGGPRPVGQVAGKDGQPAQPISKTAQGGALADRQVPEKDADASPDKQEEGKGAAGLVEDPAFQAAQNKALSAMGPEGALAAKVLQTKAGQELEEKVVGQAVKRGWWYGFGIASGVFFSGFDFMVGAIVMDAYWFAHRKDKHLFPMKGWQKAVTLFANVAPLLYALALLLIIMFTLCNTWSTKYAIKGLSYFSGSADYCQYFDIDTSAVGNSGAAMTALPNNGGTGLCKSQAFGPSSESSLSATCFGANASLASAIAGAESGGDPTAKSSTDKCADGNPVSIGLFQINLTNHQMGGLNCPAAFTRQYTAADHSCIVKADASSQTLYNNCVAAAQDPANNIQSACAISSNGAHWGQWGANSKCGFTP